MKYIVYNVYRFIGCITDQSNRSGPFSLMVMTPDLYGDRSSRPALAGCFYLQVYISPTSTFGACCQDNYH